MFKLVSFLCALALVEGGALWAPLEYSSTVLTPGSTSISQSHSSVVHPSPYALAYPYGAPLAYTHLLKKRSAPLLTYSYPYSAYSAPSVLSSWSLPTVAHAVPAVPALSYAHLIKKRSAALIAPIAPIAALPAATSYQSRIDIKNTAPLALTTPYTYASPYYGLGYAGYPYLY